MTSDQLPQRPKKRLWPWLCLAGAVASGGANVALRGSVALSPSYIPISLGAVVHHCEQNENLAAYEAWQNAQDILVRQMLPDEAVALEKAFSKAKPKVPMFAPGFCETVRERGLAALPELAVKLAEDSYAALLLQNSPLDSVRVASNATHVINEGFNRLEADFGTVTKANNIKWLGVGLFSTGLLGLLRRPKSRT